MISAGIATGGGIFEHTVLTPLWAGSPPESVMQWQYGGIQGKFFRIASPTYALCALALLVVAWWMPRQQQKWALVAGLSGIIWMVATLFFFLPILRKTQVTQGAGLEWRGDYGPGDSVQSVVLGSVGGINWRWDCRAARLQSRRARRTTFRR